LRFGQSGNAFITYRSGDLLIDPKADHVQNIAEL